MFKLVCLAALVLLVSPCVHAQSALAAGPVNRAYCEDLRSLIATPKGKGLDRFSPRTATVSGTRRFLGLDLDNDGKQDVVAMGCPAALRASHQCVVEVQLSRGGGYSVQESNLTVIHYQGMALVVAAERGAERKAGTGKALLLGAQGVKSLCTGL